MRKKWIALAATLALVAGAVPAVAATTDTTKAPPVTVPAESSAPLVSDVPGRAPKSKMSASVSKDLVNLNAATAAQLKLLPGGSDQEAATIIAGRPYNSKADLMTRKVIRAGRYAEIKKLVVAGEPAKPAAAARK